jgi:hypothetical protein
MIFPARPSFPYAGESSKWNDSRGLSENAASLHDLPTTPASIETTA